MRARTTTAVRRGLVAPLAVALLLSGCGSASQPSPPSGVDELVVPTPSPDPADFVSGVDNPWLPLPAGRTWTYDVVGVDDTHRRRVTVAPGPEVAGVSTTTRVAVEPGEVTRDLFAQDDAGNVWWFGREGEWTAGVDGAEAGLAMPAHPRVGDGYRTGYLAGVVEDVVTVVSLSGSVTVPEGSYDDLLVTRETSGLEPGHTGESYWARGVGPVEEHRSASVVRLRGVSG